MTMLWGNKFLKAPEAQLLLLVSSCGNLFPTVKAHCKFFLKYKSDFSVNKKIIDLLKSPETEIHHLKDMLFTFDSLLSRIFPFIFYKSRSYWHHAALRVTAAWLLRSSCARVPLAVLCTNKEYLLWMCCKGLLWFSISKNTFESLFKVSARGSFRSPSLILFCVSWHGILVNLFLP